jgi:DNA-binding CsgD family transcriptional regulator
MPVSVTLTSTDVSRLQAALNALLSPLDHATTESWLVAAADAGGQLLGADRALIMTPTPAGLSWTGTACDARRILSEYESHYMQYDTGVHRDRGKLGLEVYHQHHLYDVNKLHRSPVYHDWCLPHQLMDVVGMGFNPIPGREVALVHFYHDHDHGPDDAESDGAFGSRGLALLALLLPAWKAGVRTRYALGQAQTRLGAVLDALEAAVAVWDDRGRCVHENRALAALLATDPEAALLRRAMCALVRDWRQASLPPSSRAVGTGRGWYRLSASRADQAGGGRGLLILVESRDPRPAIATLARGFGLTPREAEVATLLARGERDRDIARALGISHSTARRHVEHVLGKLVVHTRAAVAGRIRGGEGVGEGTESGG